MTESQLKSKVVKLLATYPGIWYYKASDRWQSGIPDIIGCWRGKFFAIELKVKPNGPTKMQEYVIKKIRMAGGVAGVCYSVDEVKKLLCDI